MRCFILFALNHCKIKSDFQSLYFLYIIHILSVHQKIYHILYYLVSACLSSSSTLSGSTMPSRNSFHCAVICG